MLRTIPAVATASAIDGVLIRASALGVAQHASSVDTYARRRADDMLAEAKKTSSKIKRDAAQEGFAVGYELAIRGFLEFAQGLDAIRANLCSDVMVHAKSAIADHCASVDFNAAWIERWCEIHVTDAPGVVRVTVPHDMQTLFDRLRELSTKHVVVRTGSVDCITIEHGSLIHEFMAESAIFEGSAIRMIAIHPRLETEISNLAEAYALSLIGPDHE
jgi:hypothetical protein